MSSALTPSFRWAEDANHIFLTIEVESATDVVIKLDTQHLRFEGRKDGDNKTQYLLDFELAKKIQADKSSWSVKGRQVEIVLVKADDSDGYWHGILADKNQYRGRVKIDWNLWRDEDEEKGLPEDFGGMGGMGGMPGMGGGGGMNLDDAGDGEDSDDEEGLPGLDDKEGGDDEGETGDHDGATRADGEKIAPSEAEKEDESTQQTKA